MQRTASLLWTTASPLAKRGARGCLSSTVGPSPAGRRRNSGSTSALPLSLSVPRQCRLLVEETISLLLAWLFRFSNIIGGFLCLGRLCILGALNIEGICTFPLTVVPCSWQLISF